MRETRTVQSSIFYSYSNHEHGAMLENLSSQLDRQPAILELLVTDLVKPNCAHSGSSGLSIESVFRCLVLKQILQVSYRLLAFHLSDSDTYRSFTRLSV